MENIILKMTSLSQYIDLIWKRSTFPPPNIQLLYDNNEYFAVISDSEIFIRFMSADGQIFLALNTNCRRQTTTDLSPQTFYFCSKIDPILCSPTEGPNNTRDLFVLNNIAPLLA